MVGTSNLSSWRYRAVSVAGTRHMVTGTPCQDAHRVAVLDHDVVIAAVADGAGSARRAAEGSRLAVDASVDYLIPRLSLTSPGTPGECEALLDEAYAHARGVLELAVGSGDSLGDLATTLLLAIITPEWLSTIQIGDGVIVVQCGDAPLQVLTTPDEREYLNETTFLTSHEHLRERQRATLAGGCVTGLAMMSDGLQLLAVQLKDNLAHEAFFRPLFEYAGNDVEPDAELIDFLKSERVCERTDDDKTLILAVRHGPH